MFESLASTNVDISAWVLKARTNSVLYRQRQVTEILLHAVALAPGFGEGLFLKGGILMALAYGSTRNTGDVDFSVIGDPEEVRAAITSALDGALREAGRRTGHVNLLCKVQRITLRPRPETFAGSPFPALEITIGSAARQNASEMKRLDEGRASQVIRIDLSFREPIGTVQKLVLNSGGVVQAYGLYDLVAEKLRAILQQIIRPHPGSRRQDVYDISRLLPLLGLDEQEKTSILAILRLKSRERDFEPTREMISDHRIADKLRLGWETLAAELEGPLPEFELCFGQIRNFYEELPWDKEENS